MHSCGNYSKAAIGAMGLERSFEQGYRSSSSRQLSTSSRQKKALVLGSSGALGSAVSRHLSQNLNMKVLGADVAEELPTELTDEWNLDGFIRLKENADLPELTTDLINGVHNYLQEIDTDGLDPRTGNDLSGLDCIVVASGGWEGDPPLVPRDKQSMLPDEQGAFLTEAAQSYTESVMRMRKMNLDPVIAAGFVAQHMCCDVNPLVVVMGAMAALSPTPGMVGYGLAKSSTHHLVKTLGVMNGNTLESKVMRGRGMDAQPPHLFPFITVVGILPTTIDTPSNRRAMPTGNFDQWTKPQSIALEIGSWVESPALRPHSGSLVRVYASPDGEGSVFELVY